MIKDTYQKYAYITKAYGFFHEVTLNLTNAKKMAIKIDVL